MNIYRGMAQVCARSGRHWRAEAISVAHLAELNHQQSLDFLRQIPAFGQPYPQLILTGRDPLARTDLYDLIDEARRLGIGTSITPAATPALTREVLVRLKGPFPACPAPLTAPCWLSGGRRNSKSRLRSIPSPPPKPPPICRVSTRC